LSLLERQPKSVFVQSERIISRSKAYICQVERVEIECGLFSRDNVDVYLLVERNSTEASSEFPSPVGSTLWTDVNRWDGIGCWNAEKDYQILSQDSSLLRLVCKYVLGASTHRSAVVKNQLAFRYSALQAGFSTISLNTPGVMHPCAESLRFADDRDSGLKVENTELPEKIISEFSQAPGTISRWNELYYCEIEKVTVEAIDDVNATLLLQVHVHAHGDGSLGPVPSPHSSELWFPVSGTFPHSFTTVERDELQLRAVVHYRIDRVHRAHLKNNELSFQYSNYCANQSGIRIPYFSKVKLDISGWEDPEDDLSRPSKCMRGAGYISSLKIRNSSDFQLVATEGSSHLNHSATASSNWYLITLATGDPSGDGHGMRDVYGVKSNLPQAQLLSAFQEGVKLLGYDITRYCQEYEMAEIHPAFLQALKTAGFWGHDGNTQEELELSPERFVKIFLFTVKLGNPSFDYSFVNFPSLNIGGYGLYFN